MPRVSTQNGQASPYQRIIFCNKPPTLEIRTQTLCAYIHPYGTVTHKGATKTALHINSVTSGLSHFPTIFCTFLLQFAEYFFTFFFVSSFHVPLSIVVFSLSNSLIASCMHLLSNDSLITLAGKLH